MILVDASPLQSEHRHRGVGTYTRYLTENLVKLEPDAVRFVGTKRDAALLPQAVRDRAFLAHRGHRPAQVYWLYNEWFLRRTLARVRPAVFHATDFNGLLSSPGVRTIATLYDLTPLKEGLRHHDLSGRLGDLRWWIYYRHKLPRAEHIIAISEQARVDAINFLGIPAGRMTVIPLGVDLDRFRPMGGEGPYASQPPYLLFVGSRAPNKNLPRILEAFAAISHRCPEIHLTITGPWRSVDEAWLAQTARRLGVAGRVRHLGFIPQSDLPGLYANALACLFPSLEEGFGLPILEAMASGTAVLTSDRGVLVEVAGTSALLVDPTDVAALAAGIHDLICDADLRDDLVRRGLDRVRAFRWEDVARRTLDVYRLVGARSTGLSATRSQ